MSRLCAKRVKSWLLSVLEHIGIKIPLISHRSSFRNLSNIVKHSALSKRVTSLFYMCDRLNFDKLPFEVCWATRTHASEMIPECPAYELQALLELFRICRNIREVAVASEMVCKGHSRH
jgi:hypothetical protein